MTRKDEETKEQEALLVLLMLMVFPPKIIIIISTKNRKIARRKVSFCCYLASTFSLFLCLCWCYRYDCCCGCCYFCCTISQQHRASCSSTQWCACDQYFRQKHLKGRFSLITLIMSISFPFILFSIFVFGNFRTTFNVKQCKLVLRS